MATGGNGGNGSGGYGDESLQTMSRDGRIPETRMRDAAQCVDFVRRLIDNDEKRSKKRALTAGLVDGNPPYNHRRLRDAGRADACNVNWGTARSYFEGAWGAFYDLSSQAPGFVEIETGATGTEEQRAEWSRTMSKHADRMFMDDEDYDSDIQLSQKEMVLYQNGPLIFETEHQVFPIAITCGSLLVPEKTPSKLSRWEVAVVVWNYYPTELYDFIREEGPAEKLGWNVDFTKLAIANAMDVRQPDSTNTQNWEFYQDELKANSLSYYDDSKICKVAWLYWKEFDGSITQALVEREPSTADTPKDGSYKSEIKNRGVNYLYFKRGRYKAFKECVHPMYCDGGRGGMHHMVTGLGVKMFGAAENENRLLCNLYDKAMAPKQFFVPGSAESKEKMQVTRYTDYGVLPPGTTMVQAPIQGFLTDGLQMFRTSSELLRSTLASYRQPAEIDRPGNPETAFKEKMKASQQGELSNTTYNMYYRQLDLLYTEIIRRACNLNTTDTRAKRFQQACLDDGLPRECFGRVRMVRAVRVVGRGSPFLRAQTTSELAPIIGRCSEDGQNNWTNDFIASRAGQDAVRRYNPKPTSKQLASDQQERAQNQIVGMRNGVTPVVTASQNALTFAGAFLTACVNAIKTVKQGANIAEVVQFLDIAGPATARHIKRLQGDTMRKDVVGELEQQLKRVEQMAKKLKGMAQAQAKQQKLQQQKTGQVMNDLQLKNLKTKTELNLKAQKQRHGMAMKTTQTRQNLALNDARTASDLHNNRLRAFQE